MVLSHKKLFYGHEIGFELLDQILYLLVDRQEPYRKLSLGFCLDDAVINYRKLVSALIDNAVACNGISRVNSDNPMGFLLRH